MAVFFGNGLVWPCLLSTALVCSAGASSAPVRAWLRVWPKEQRELTSAELQALIFQGGLDCDEAFRSSDLAPAAEGTKSWLCLGTVREIETAMVNLSPGLVGKTVPFVPPVPKLKAVARAEKATVDWSSASWYESFHDAEELLATIDGLGTTPFTEPIPSIATTFEGRSVKGLYLRGSGATADSPMVIISAGLHARETGATSGTFYALNKLVNELYTNLSSPVNNHLGKIQLAIFPLMNPDGYQYAITEDAMYRTNRNTTSSQASGCRNAYYGVDPNRNFHGFQSWGTLGVNHNPCSSSQTFPGREAFDQAESRGLKEFVEQQKAKGVHIIMGIDIHTYGPLILHPYGFCHECPTHPLSAQITALSNAMRVAAGAVKGEKYKVMSSADLYPVGGATDDWYSDVTTGSYDRPGEGIGFTMEMTRGGGRNPFDMPQEKIPQTGGEVAAILQEAISHAAAVTITNNEGCGSFSKKEICNQFKSCQWLSGGCVDVCESLKNKKCKKKSQFCEFKNKRCTSLAQSARRAAELLV